MKYYYTIKNIPLYNGIYTHKAYRHLLQTLIKEGKRDDVTSIKINSTIIPKNKEKPENLITFNKIKFKKVKNSPLYEILLD